MKVVFDTTTMQVGCALIQAQYGALDNEHLHLFPTETWFLTPTDTMGVYPVTEAQLEKLIQMSTNAVAKKGKRH